MEAFFFCNPTNLNYFGFEKNHLPVRRSYYILDLCRALRLLPFIILLSEGGY